MPTARRGSLLFELYVAGHLANELVTRESERRGISVGRQVLLVHIARHGPITPSELERESGLRPSTLRERMQPLLDDGLVRRRPSAEDRRSHTLEITDRGQEFLAERWPVVLAAQQALEAELGGALEEYRPALERIVQAAQAALAAD